MTIVLQILKRLLGSKIAVGALLCLAAVAAAKIYGETRWRAGYEAHKLEMVEAAAQAERERIKDEARFKDLSIYDVCAEYLRSRACQSQTVSNCAGFRSNDLSPAGSVALASADRPGFERVVANDANYKRLGCP